MVLTLREVGFLLAICDIASNLAVFCHSFACRVPVGTRLPGTAWYLACRKARLFISLRAQRNDTPERAPLEALPVALHLAGGSPSTSLRALAFPPKCPRFACVTRFSRNDA
ncbi:MAG: hypothetical protein HYS86_01720 [Candidatus Chisholmbacteria bacterium]|nr:hypothetical protein [Candidatus Chisholmbacteria bacterium]